MFDRVTKKLFCNKGSGADFKIPGDITIPWARDNEEGSCKYDIDCASEGECSICDPSTKTCQNGCTEVEYLESTGTQYIDTGYTYTSLNHKTVCTFSTVSASSSAPYWLFGSLSATSARSGGLALQSNLTKIGIGIGNIAAGSTTYTIDNPTSKITVSVESKNNNTFSVTGGSQDYVNIAFGTSSLSGRTEAIFATNNAAGVDSFSAFKLYTHQIYNSDTLVRDFIPVLDLDGVPAMYDKVEKKLYYNLGSGNFLYGAAK